jgi:hypothetical protein
MATFRAITLAVLCTAFTLPAAAAADDPPYPDRIRPAAPYIAAFLRDGVASSATFRALVERIGKSDVIVYVMPADLGSRVRGQLRFMGASRGTRYLQIEIGWQLSAARAIASLGHELQHAVEVADAPWVQDVEGMEREFARIGYSSTPQRFGETSFDTHAAVHAGYRVWLELATEADD